MRPFASWPPSFLRLVHRLRIMSWAWPDIAIELHYRDVVEPMLDATDDETGPWACVAPRGRH